MKREALCFKIGGFSLVNEQLARELPAQFPDYQLRWLDIVDDILKPQPARYLAASAEVVLRYGRRIASRRLPPRTFLPWSSVFLRAMAGWIRQNVNPEKIAFTFQTQSLFDASTAGLAHFLYTDHTRLANLRYPRPKALMPASATWQLMEKNLYQRAAVNFTTSEFCALSLREDYGIPAARVANVFSGINLDFPTIPAKGSATGGRILFIGVDWERKGGPELLQAFRQLRSEFPRAELHILGCDPHLNEQGVVIHGRVPRDQVGAHLEKADIFCMPSRAEPSAVALVEASAFGLPVVTTKVGGSVERVRDNETGFLVEPGNREQLVQVVRRLLSNPDLRVQMGAKGRNFAREFFTWPAVAAKIATGIRQQLTTQE